MYKSLKHAILVIFYPMNRDECVVRCFRYPGYQDLASQKQHLT